MKALVFDKRLKLVLDYPAPDLKENEALIRVKYAGICATDLEIIKGYMGFKGVPGHEFSGVVEACEIPGLIGRRVTGEINLGCGRCAYCAGGMRNHCPQRSVLGILGKDGAFAEYLTLPIDNLHVLPDEISDEEGVFVEPLASAFEILSQIEIGRGTRVAVLGDGRLGILTAEVLSLSGCPLTAIGRHEEKLAILKARGIETAAGTEGLGSEFDIVVECTGRAEGLSTALKLVKPRGTVVLKTTVAERDGADLNRAVIDEVTIIGSRCGPFKPAIAALKERAVDVRMLVSRVFALEEGIEAFQYASQSGVLKALIKVE
ncbi:MAG: alcohol dehydrogenase [Deltaproteobacteria bacterium GWC2_56_8]|nr:MAG: alcohol dehydrogenase [Deltaproteobacteria bacterium GWB2_55_19]OGP34413.1 MAG: alcohol dehydrogenase [Deltaproteobacteria bacterium GWC2_56_8]